MISVEEDAEPAWLLWSEFNERNAELSPDGNRLAYPSDESGSRLPVLVWGRLDSWIRLGSANSDHSDFAEKRRQVGPRQSTCSYSRHTGIVDFCRDHLNTGQFRCQGRGSYKHVPVSLTSSPFPRII